MATFNHPVGVGPRDGSGFQRVIVRVDTRNTYTVMPAPLLTMLGVEPEWTSEFELADESREERSLAEVRVKIGGQDRTTICVFGPPESEPVLGAYTLDGLGLEANSAGKKLVPRRLFLA